MANQLRVVRRRFRTEGVWGRSPVGGRFAAEWVCWAIKGFGHKAASYPVTNPSQFFMYSMNGSDSPSERK